MAEDTGLELIPVMFLLVLKCSKSLKFQRLFICNVSSCCVVFQIFYGKFYGKLAETCRNLLEICIKKDDHNSRPFSSAFTCLSC